MDHAEGRVLVFIQGKYLQTAFPLAMVLILSCIKKVSGRGQLLEVMDEVTIVGGSGLRTIVHLGPDEVNRVRGGR